MDSIVAIPPHVQVRCWLFLPTLLNFSAAVFLVLTMVLTSRSDVPLWKTSLMATYQNGLAPGPHNDADRTSREASDMKLNPEQVKVRFLNSHWGEDSI
jgi:hypothetical protein